MINYVIGDATCPIGDGPKIIAHVVNDVGAFGRGFALAVAQRWPSAELAYRCWYRSHQLALGRVLVAQVDSGVWVAHMCAQSGLRGPGNAVPLQIDALTVCLSKLLGIARERVASVTMPRIGCGLSGASWEAVGPIVERELNGVDVYVYDLPVKK